MGLFRPVGPVSPLYSPWGPFPDHFVEQTTIFRPFVRRARLGTVPTGSLTVKRISQDRPFLSRPVRANFLFLFVIFWPFFGQGPILPDWNSTPQQLVSKPFYPPNRQLQAGWPANRFQQAWEAAANKKCTD